MPYIKKTIIKTLWWRKDIFKKYARLSAFYNQIKNKFYQRLFGDIFAYFIVMAHVFCQSKTPGKK